ncbi:MULTISPECIES: CDP-glycerol glycerophosphotransferase family protein [unclassified Acinetobacter]|uniref:CDP-glycerol glycerophosphotransferase family protein n=1 Tax=unclassified Acinetobacter TaxID=196816 RepID=UPI0015D44316|nr:MULTISPECIES: CDP-glycerol glycerophosphotransferase family protein [unclassified Acinetobacter]
MLDFLKKLLPTTFKDWLRPFKMTLVDNPKKRKLFLHMQRKHQELLHQIKGKEKIKVVFLAIHKSVWKVDPVFQKMLNDPFFEPVILVCPYTVYGEERMKQDMQECYEYFKEKGYPLLSSYHAEEQRWITLEEIQPDIVFFTNPHNLTRKEYYEDAYLNYLSCYAGYGMPISKYENYQAQFNQVFHNAIWKIFVQTVEMVENYKNISQRGRVGIELVGDCLVEQLRGTRFDQSTWKNAKQKIKIIYAPHHTIEDNKIFSISTFLENAFFIKEIALKYKDDIYWSFKPHPLLKEKLLIHPDWGKQRTEDYYGFWIEFESSQVDEGEYIDLFKNSDAMILDSSSFLGEYLFVDKPILYLLKKDSLNYFSSFGHKCLSVSSQALGNKEIENFIVQMLNDTDVNQHKRCVLIDDYDRSLGYKIDTSTRILKILKQ